MKKEIKIVLCAIFCFVNVINVLAQQKPAEISGVITQKKNYEITIVGKAEGKSFRAIQYLIDTATNKFSIVMPVLANTSYEMRVAVMKMGHRRLETDYVVNFPLKLVAGQKLNIALDEAAFKAKKGFIIAKQAAKFPMTQVSGKVVTSLKWAIDLSLEKVVEGRCQTIETYTIAKSDSTFNFNLPIQKEGLYYLSSARFKKRLYLKPNDQINLVFDYNTGVELSASKTTEANRLISEWERLINPLKLMSLEKKPDREAFSALYKPLQVKVSDFIRQVKTADPAFNSLFKVAVQMDNSLLALNMLLKSSTEKRGGYIYQSKNFLAVPDYYQQLLRDNSIKSGQILQLGEGYDYINLYARFCLNHLNENQKAQMGDAERVKLLMNAITNDSLKSFVLKAQLEELELNIANYSEFRDTFMPYQKYAKPSSVKQKYEAQLKTFIADTAFIGKSAADFILPDASGKMVSMKDFKGKVVLIDVWATWCGPCKAQIPFLKEVEEHYKGNNNVVFVGISLDAEKDKEKWLGMIKEKALEGVQLLDNVGDAFGRKYKMVAIPRFLLIDKRGNWAEVRCPLPENKEKLKGYIDRELSRSL
ncbi:TlpA family protein disulfide reductase [Pedobacter sp. HDW13]|uniref:redoxin family protein n=1 Tax=Pedobacter sp. HDW13 TaxID=2714940 RepID=UPI00140B9AA3|nr:redoxin family protein [Pedobacter sp. HDW13]QIL40515.1 TlpA family protein disulfide reductase [Pedobacter sp. HDW13]